MGRKRTAPTVYLVHWPEIGVVKVGTSEHRRWRSFLTLGGVVLGLWEHDTSSNAYGMEGAAQHELDIIAPRAFSSADDAEPYLGGRGGGYLECYYADADRSLGLLADVGSQYAGAYALALPRHAESLCTDGRTYGLTEKHLRLRSIGSTTSRARGAAR